MNIFGFAAYLKPRGLKQWIT